jgi:hypothetical protein
VETFPQRHREVSPITGGEFEEVRERTRGHARILARRTRCPQFGSLFFKERDTCCADPSAMY